MKPPSFFQPTEFNQLDHKKRFKIVIKSELIVLTFCVSSFFLVLYFLEPGSLSRWGPMQTASVVTSKEDEVSTIFPFLTLGVAWGLTALMMAVSDFVARVMKPAPTASRPVTCTVGFFTNNIPFLTLNFSIVIGIFANMVMIHLFNTFGAHGVQISTILTVLLVTNEKARKHVKFRLQQKFDSFTVGGTHFAQTNSVPPPPPGLNNTHVVGMALVQLGEGWAAPYGRNPAHV